MCEMGASGWTRSTGREGKAHHVLITLHCVPLDSEDSEEGGAGSK